MDKAALKLWQLLSLLAVVGVVVGNATAFFLYQNKVLPALAETPIIKQNLDLAQPLADQISFLAEQLKSLESPTQSNIYQTIVSADSDSNSASEINLTQDELTSLFPGAVGGNPIYFDSEIWKTASDLFFSSGKIGIGKTAGVPLDVAGDASINGKVTIYSDEEDHLIQLIPKNNTGYLSSSGGALYLNNTDNPGTGIGIYSNAGSEALGNMINVKVDNPEFGQAAFYMNYDGLSNAVEIVANTNDRSSNALSLTNYNQLDSGLGVIGYELDRGSIKVTHNGTGNDGSASGLSIDLKGTGTAAQGVYVDSTATGGTTGKLLRLRNESIDRFVVDYLGSTSIGSTGTNTTLTKLGNSANDHFYVGTTGAFRVQRAASNSEAFRVQVSGDSYGRWLGTSDGKLRWSDGSSDYDVTLERTAANTLSLSGGTLNVKSATTNSDVAVWTASDGSRLGRVVETSGGHGWFEIDDNTGSAKIVFRADGGNSYINSGNVGIGTTSFGTSAAKVLAIGNGTAPSTSIADGIQLFAVDFDSGDGSATSELRVRDEDGNVTTLSPHNFSLLTESPQNLDWSYFSQKDNLAINANMAEVIRQVEKLSGEQLIYIKNLETGEYEQRTIPKPNPIQEILSKLVVSAEAVFNQAAVFVSKVAFQGETTFDGQATFNQVPMVGEDQAGEAVVAAGETEIKISFSRSFDQAPVVVVTPNDFIQGSYKISKQADSFAIILEQSQDGPRKFDWQAIQTTKVRDADQNMDVVLETAISTEEGSASGELAN